MMKKWIKTLHYTQLILFKVSSFHVHVYGVYKTLHYAQLILLKWSSFHVHVYGVYNPKAIKVDNFLSRYRNGVMGAYKFFCVLQMIIGI